MNNYNILIVDDDNQNLHVTKMFLEDYGYNVTTTSSPLKALEIYNKNKFDYAILLLDYHMKEFNGDLLAQKIHEINK